MVSEIGVVALFTWVENGIATIGTLSFRRNIEAVTGEAIEGEGVGTEALVVEESQSWETGSANRSRG